MTRFTFKAALPLGVAGFVLLLVGAGSPSAQEQETEAVPAWVDSSKPPPGVPLVTDPFKEVRPRGPRVSFDPRVFKSRPINLRAWYPRERADMESPGMRRGFPAVGSNYVVLGPSNRKYNCIAWTIDVTDQWVWPGAAVADFDRLYGRAGYKRLGQMDYRRRRGYEKIVLYARVSEGRYECTHGAYQTPDGQWTSKLGKGPLIAHRTPEALSGPSYGRPVFVYSRRDPAVRLLGSPAPDKD